jgi:hypothetical protein
MSYLFSDHQRALAPLLFPATEVGPDALRKAAALPGGHPGVVFNGLQLLRTADREPSQVSQAAARAYSRRQS